MLVNVILKQKDASVALDEAFFKTPFPPYDPIY